jgi:hypothetical protein
MCAQLRACRSAADQLPGPPVAPRIVRGHRRRLHGPDQCFGAKTGESDTRTRRTADQATRAPLLRPRPCSTGCTSGDGLREPTRGARALTPGGPGGTQRAADGSTRPATGEPAIWARGLPREAPHHPHRRAERNRQPTIGTCPAAGGPGGEAPPAWGSGGSAPEDTPPSRGAKPNEVRRAAEDKNVPSGGGSGGRSPPGVGSGGSAPRRHPPSRTGKLRRSRSEQAKPRDGGQGRGRTADLPLFRRSLVPTELPGRDRC